MGDIVFKMRIVIFSESSDPFVISSSVVGSLDVNPKITHFELHIRRNIRAYTIHHRAKH